MIKKDVLISIFNSFGIKKVWLKEENNFYNFIIGDMNVSFSLDRWCLLENYLKELLDKNINILSYPQVLANFSSSYIQESLVIL